MYIEPLFDIEEIEKIEKVIRISNEDNTFESYLFEIPSNDDEEPSNNFLFYDFGKRMGITQIRDIDEFMERLPQKRAKIYEKNSQGFRKFKIKMNLFLFENKRKSSFFYLKEVFKRKTNEDEDVPTLKLNLTITPTYGVEEEKKESL